jgi:3-oxoadipate enol-lactonase
MPETEINGTTLHWQQIGTGEPVALLNGVMMTEQSWAPQINALSERYSCLVHDMRGQLLSAKPPGPYSMEQHADDLAALLDHLGIHSCHVVGTSYGGEVGLIFAAGYPERVRTLTVIASVAHVESLLHDQVQAWADATAGGPAALFDSVAELTYGSRFREANPDLLELARQRVEALPEDFFPAFVRLVEAFQKLDVRDRLPSITAPTLVICGEQDRIKPVPYSREIAAAIPAAALILVPDAGHAVFLEAVDVVNTAILQFIAEYE